MQRVGELQHPQHLDIPPGDPEPSAAIHGVHYAGCQDDAREIIVSRCGIALEAIGHQASVNSDTMRGCTACNRVAVCPVCGIDLPHTVTELISWRDWE